MRNLIVRINLDSNFSDPNKQIEAEGKFNSFSSALTGAGTKLAGPQGLGPQCFLIGLDQLMSSLAATPPLPPQIEIHVFSLAAPKEQLCCTDATQTDDLESYLLKLRQD